MKRHITAQIKKDLPKKIILITGPRQCGKTTLSQMLSENYAYYNYDSDEDRIALTKKAWSKTVDTIIFDELHKKNEWKRWLKGIYDTQGIPPAIIVTGSSKLDTYRKAGDSLAGRFFKFRLHPFDIQEVLNEFSINEAFERLWNFGPFPEPFLEGELSYYHRWKTTHRDIILRQDLIDFHALRDIQGVETLIKLVETRVSGTVNYTNLGRDLERDGNTVKRWLGHLENVYIIFAIKPYATNVARAIRKDAKYYLYDYASIQDPGAKLENMVATTLLKHIHYLEDVKGIKIELNFLRSKEGKEIDFILLKDNSPLALIEVKLNDSNVSKHLRYFRKFFPRTLFIQLTQNITKPLYIDNKTEIHPVANWLAELNLENLMFRKH